MRNYFYPIFLCLIIISCGSEDPDEDAVLTSLEIQSSNGDRLDVHIDQMTTLSVIGYDQHGKSFTITSALVWSVDNGNVSIDPSGKVTSLSVGTSEITVETEGISTSFLVTIWDSSVPRVELFVSDVENLDNPPWRIHRFFADGSYAELFTDQNLGWPQDIVVLEDQEVVLVSNLNTNSITKYNVDNGEYLGIFASGISGPTRMKIGADNLLYVLQWSGNGLVKRYQLDGTFVDNFTTVGVAQSIGLDWDKEGNLYVSSYSNGTIRKFDEDGKDIGLFVNSNIQGPTNIWFDPDGNLNANDWDGGVVAQFNSDGSFVKNLITGLAQPEGIDFYQDNYLIGNGGSGAIKQYTVNGTFIKDLVPAGTNGLKKPNAVLVRRVNE